MPEGTDINYQEELTYIMSLLPSRSQRKALARHLRHLNREIIDAEEAGEPFIVMQLTFDCLMQVVDLLESITQLKSSINGAYHE